MRTFANNRVNETRRTLRREIRIYKSLLRRQERTLVEIRSGYPYWGRRGRRYRMGALTNRTTILQHEEHVAHVAGKLREAKRAAREMRPSRFPSRPRVKHDSRRF